MTLHSRIPAIIALATTLVLGAGVLKVLKELLVALVTLGRIFVEHPVDHIGGGPGNPGGKSLQAQRLALEMLERHQVGVIGFEEILRSIFGEVKI